MSYFCRGRCPHRPVAPTMPNTTRNHAVGTPILGRPNPVDFDSICVITILSPLGSACIGRLGRGVPTDSNAHLFVSREAIPPPPWGTSLYTREALVRREVRSACTQPPVPPFKGGLGAYLIDGAYSGRFVNRRYGVRGAATIKAVHSVLRGARQGCRALREDYGASRMLRATGGIRARQGCCALRQNRQMTKDFLL